jgi:hypothetical protein
VTLTVDGKPVELLFGKDTAIANKVYAMVEGSKSAEVVPNNLRNDIAKKADEFRDKEAERSHPRSGHQSGIQDQRRRDRGREKERPLVAGSAAQDTRRRLEDRRRRVAGNPPPGSSRSSRTHRNLATTVSNSPAVP